MFFAAIKSHFILFVIIFSICLLSLRSLIFNDSPVARWPTSDSIGVLAASMVAMAIFLGSCRGTPQSDHVTGVLRVEEGKV